MKMHQKISIVTAAISLLSLSAPFTAFATAAVAPNLGTSASFSVFGGSAMTADSSGATVSGDLGVNPGLSASGPWTVGGTSYFGTGGLSGTAKTDATTAYTSMNTTNKPGGTTWNPVSDLTPTAGLYTVAGSATITGNLTLSGSASDVWIFQIADSLTFSNAATITLGGSASACNVYWYISSDATINGSPATKFVGTLIANGNVSLVTGPTVIGRMMALTGTLSSAGTSNVSGCATGTTRPSRANAPTITVVKSVINDNGGKKIVGDFSLFVADRLVGSGVANTFPFPASYVVSETPDSGYAATFSGDCDSTGHISLAANEHKVCTITNNDVVPPVPAIAITKTPSPLSLPFGPGPVTYTYAVTNTGKVALNTVGVKDDKCSPVQYVSGDTNSDGLLGLTETWTYDCFKTLSQTETNIATAHGRGVGMDVYATSTATVVVTPSVAPLAQIPATSLPVTPGFPNTGFAPYGSSFWNSILTVGVLAVVAAATIVYRKRRA